MKFDKKTCFVWTVLMLILFACASTQEDPTQRKEEAEAKRNLGEAYLKEHNYAAALRELKRAEALAPDDHYLQYDLGLAYLGKAKHDLAIKHFKKAIAIKPDFGAAVNSLGNAYAAKGDWDQAIVHYNQVLENLLYASPHIPLSNLGWAYYNKADYQTAESYFLRSLAAAPTFVLGLRGLAKTYVAMKRYPEAIAKLEKAIELAPESADSARLYFELAEAYQLAGSNLNARTTYFKVVELDPHSQLADLAKQRAKALDGSE
jgi:type IV pilus biogenesis/stability protein PilW